MRKELTTLFFLLSLLASFGQVDQARRIRLSGNISDDQQKPVSYAHIMEYSRQEGWVSDYYGEFRADVLPGDTLIVSAVSYHHARICIPADITVNEYMVEVILQPDTVQLKELVIHPWPATLSDLKREFMKVDVNDPDSEINLNMPSMKDIANMLRTPGEPGQIGLYSGSGPLSLIYDQFSREARNKRNYAVAMRIEKVNSRYNKIVVSKVTGLSKDEDVQRFMQFCSLEVKFVLESTDYELYAAILKCYNEFCAAGLLEQGEGK